MHQRDRRHQRDAGGQAPAAELDRRLQLAQHRGDHRSDAQRLLDDRVEIGVVAFTRPRQRVGMAQQALERPSEPGRGRLVTGHQQRDDLVAQLVVIELAGAHQLRQHVLALLKLRIYASSGDLLVQQTVGLEHGTPVRAPAPYPAKAGHDPHRHDPEADLRGGGQHLAQRAQALRVADADHRLQDRLERDRAHARMQRKRPSDRPAADLLGDDPLDHLAVAADRLAVKRRQQALADLQVLVAIEHQHRALAEHRCEHRVAVACVEHRRVAGKDLLDEVAVVDHDGAAPGKRANREHRAVLLAVGGEERHRPMPDEEALRRHRHARTGRKFAAHLHGRGGRIRGGVVFADPLGGRGRVVGGSNPRGYCRLIDGRHARISLSSHRTRPVREGLSLHNFPPATLGIDRCYII